MNGVMFDYYSFTAEEYESLLAGAGLQMTQHFENDSGNWVYLAQKAVA